MITTMLAVLIGTAGSLLALFVAPVSIIAGYRRWGAAYGLAGLALAAAAGLWALTGLSLAMVGLAGLLALGGFWLYTLPGTRTIPPNGRAAAGELRTLDDLIEAVRTSGREGWDLVDYAQKLAARHVQYCRCNPWDSPRRAFARGLGYCQQQALALQEAYAALDVDSRPVYTTKARFPARGSEPERVSGHTWLHVTVGGETRDVCPGDLTNAPGRVHFETLAPVRPLHPWLRPWTHLGSAFVNADRAYARRGLQLGDVADPGDVR
jgi:hypothetical protein